MFMVKYKQRDIQKRITIALVLICLAVCTVDVQLYFEHQILAHIVTCTNRLNQQENYFHMSINELMKVVVVSQLDIRHSSFLLNFPCYYPNWIQQPA
jgi:hypothetical protein